MNNLYKDVYCMSFTNQEIIEFLIKPLRKYSNIIIRISSSEDIELFEDTEEKISFVSFDGERENFCISFYNYQTSIFISDEDAVLQHKSTFNEEFMFIDDDIKHQYTLSDTYKNVVYNGYLRGMTHKQILELFLEFIILLNGAKKILIEETVISQEGINYPECKYIIKIYNDSDVQKSVEYENILFLVNEITL